MDYLLNIIITSLFCAGLRKASAPDMLLNGVAKWLYYIAGGKVGYNDIIDGKYAYLEEKDPSFWYWPVIGCVYCYASFWGTILYWVLELYVWGYETTPATWIMWPVTCVACVFLNGLFYNTLKKLE